MSKNVEQKIQIELIKWISFHYPEILKVYVKNEGKKNIIAATLDKKMGLCKGHPDLHLEIDRDYTYIFKLELKTKSAIKKKNKGLTDSQVEWWSDFKPTLNKQGVVAYGLIEAQKKIKEWIDGLE